MKRSLLLPCVLITGLIMTTSIAKAVYVAPVDTIQVPPTRTTITFDGLDNEASWSAKHEMTVFSSTASYGGATDFSGYFRVCYDTNYFYFYAHVTDDIEDDVTAADIHTYPYDYDNVEVFLDLDTNSVVTSYDDDAIQLRFNRGQDTVTTTGRTTASSYKYYWHNISGGWVVEVGIPWTAVLPAGSLPHAIMNYIHNHMGFDVQFSDSDGDPVPGSRDVQMAWDLDGGNYLENDAWENTSLFGIMDLMPATAFPVKYTKKVAICHGDSVYAGGSYQTSSGTYQDTYTDGAGVDSTVITELSVFPVFSFENSYTLCQGDSMYLNGKYQRSTSDFTGNFQTIHGCDSIVVDHLIVNKSYRSVVNKTICQGDSYYAGGAEQTVSGTYTDTYNTISGCDSTITTNLEVMPHYFNLADTTICEGDSFFVGGAYQDQGGLYYDSLISVSGCDSVVAILLKVKQCLSGIEHHSSEAGLMVFPNPTHNSITVSCNGLSQLQLYSETGQLILTTSHKHLDLSTYPEGIYYLRVITTQGKIISQKVSYSK